MKITVAQQIQLSENIRSFRTVYKHFESPVILHKGDFFADSAFKDPYEFEVDSVIINYADDTCYVSIFPYVIDSAKEEFVREHVSMMTKYHGWECPIEDMMTT